MVSELVYRNVLAEIDEESLARDCLDFVAVKSETGAEGPGAEFFAGLLRQIGLEPAYDEIEPGRANVGTRWAGVGRGPCLLLNGHVDTIPEGKCIAPGRAGEWITGRGAEDMKGGLTAMIHAVGAIIRSGVKLKGDVWLTGVVGHESPVGKKEGPLRLIERINQRAIRPDAILIVEGPAAIWTASLGCAMFRITLADDRGPIHTIKVPFQSNPIRAVATLLNKLDGLEEQLSAEPGHPLAGRDQVNVGMVSAGDFPNRLPASVVVTGTRRWTPGHDAKEILEELSLICDETARLHGLRGTVELQGTREPFETSSAHPLVKSLQITGERLTGRAPEIVGMGLVGDANLYVRETGVPSVYYGPAHETAHSDHERIDVKQLVHITQMYALATLEYCGV